MADEISNAIADAHLYADPERFHALFTRLRREEPVRWTTPEGVRPFWTLSRHADIVEVERQPQLFPSGPRLELFSIAQEEKIMKAMGGNRAVSRTMLHMDGAEHKAYRGLTQSWFMPGNLKKLDEGLAALAREYTDKLARAGSQVDFVLAVAELYPLRVIMMILGLPPEDAPELLRLTHNFNRRADARVTSEQERDNLLVKAAQEIFAYFGRIYEDRMKQPRDDVATVIAQATIDGKPINRLEALSYYLLLGLAGHDTTNGTIAGTLLALIQNPDQLARLKAEPELLTTAVDEMLRWVSPVNNFMRTASADYVLRGQRIRAGDSLLLCFRAANRDEEVFEDPFAFRVDRKPNPHLAFGHGAHACLGQHLAKMELRALFRELLPRLEHVELAGQHLWLAAVTANHLMHLPIRCRVRA